MEKYDLKRFGLGTAYDCYITANKLNESSKSEASKPTEHSNENYNPGKQSDIDS